MVYLKIPYDIVDHGRSKAVDVDLGKPIAVGYLLLLILGDFGCRPRP